MTSRIYCSFHSISRLLFASLVVLFSSLSCVTAHYVRQAIVGGTPVTDAYPFLAFSSGFELCGATLIWSDVLLSAGHCVNAFLNSGVWIGGIQLSGADGEFHQVEQVLVHPEYPVAATQPHDIMLFKIATASFQQPAILATNTDLPAEGFSVRVLGFGNTEYGSVSQFAKQVDVSVVNFTACDELYGGKLIEAQFCTDGNGDSCQGDSGGPLLNSNGEQVGIVSFGEGCDEYPSVNTRVSYYSAWIQEGICNISSSPPTDCALLAAPTPVSTSAPKPAPTSTPTFLPIPFLTAAPITTAPPVTPVTSVPIVTPSPTSIVRSDPPSDSPSAIPSLAPSFTTVKESSEPTILLPTANETGSPTSTPETPLESSEHQSESPHGDRPSEAPVSSGVTSWYPSASQQRLLQRHAAFPCIVGWATSLILSYN